MTNEALYNYIKSQLIAKQDSVRKAYSGVKGKSDSTQWEANNARALELLESYKDNPDSLKYIYEGMLKGGMAPAPQMIQGTDAPLPQTDYSKLLFNPTSSFLGTEDGSFNVPTMLPEVTATPAKTPGLAEYLTDHIERRRGWVNSTADGRGSTTRYNSMRDNLQSVIDRGDDAALQKLHDQLVEYEGLIPYQSFDLYNGKTPPGYKSPMDLYGGNQKLEPKGYTPSNLTFNPTLKESTNQVNVNSNPYVDATPMTSLLEDWSNPDDIRATIDSRIPNTLTADTASSYPNGNAGGVKSGGFQPRVDMLRFAPAVGSLIDILTPEKATNTTFARMSAPDKIIPGTISETSMNPTLDSLYNTSVGNIVNSSGGSNSAVRANLQGAGLTAGRTKAQAISDILKFNQMTKQRANTLNSQNQMQVNSTNAQIGMQETIANEQNQAAARNSNYEAWVNLFDNLGNVGVDDFRVRSVGAGTGYNPLTFKKIKTGR